MQKTAKATSRILALLLAVVLLTGIIPTTVFAIDEPLSGSTGTGWDDIGGEVVDNGNGNVSDSGNPPPVDNENEDTGDGDNGVVDADDLDDVDDSNPATPGTLGMSGTPADSAVNDFNAMIQAYQAWADAQQNSRASLLRAGINISTSQIMLGGQISWASGDPSNPYYISGSLPKIYVDGKIAFCGEFNDQSPSGSYSLSGTGSDSTILRLLANYDASGGGDAAYVATQVAIWQHLSTGSVNASNVSWNGCTGSSAANAIFNGNASTSGLTYNLYVGGSQDVVMLTYDTPENDYALKIIKKNEDGSSVISGATFSITGPGGFSETNKKTNASGEILVGINTPGQYTVTETAPPAGYELADPSSQQVTVTTSHTPDNPAVVEFRNKEGEGGDGGEGEIIVETDQETVTEVRNSKEYSYSDAIGQITIRKHDQDGRSLDGALYNIRVAFTDGSHILVENWEVDNGARLFTWTHPNDNHDPATVTVWEVQPPRYYDLDPTPKTAVVHPTYTRVTHVTTWTVTITTTTTNVTIIKDGEVIEENSSTATATTESDPQVEEFTDFIAGDREITVTFVNTRQTGDICVC